ncbi:hypothetical protein [Arcobacter sp. FWKO B]|uniref:hypothetical protein n=1 Tax=Arcobacter sp. FWKO B TaxID=2593672 RepID=UPI0018A4EB6B|nr:hypothetical protein [Arcobacter sp. FWKO B]QOG12820.1 hypothetical protein FWKOB_08990 [Arcobacter sp. FWKO B]
MEWLLYIVFFLIVLFCIVFFLKKHYEDKAKNLASLKNGICPNCGAKSDKDESVIEYKLLNNGGCSGVSDVLYTCIKCDKSYFAQERISRPSCG